MVRNRPRPRSRPGRLECEELRLGASACGYPDATTTGVHDRAAFEAVPRDLTSGPGWTWTPRLAAGDGERGDRRELEGSVPSRSPCECHCPHNVIVQPARHGESAFAHHKRHCEGQHDRGRRAHPRLLAGVKDIYGDAVSTTVVGNDISGTSNGSKWGGVIRDNYIQTWA